MGDVCIFLEAVAVDDDVLGAEGQLVQCQVHGGNGGVEDVDFVDFVVVDGGYGPGCGFRFNDVAQFFPLPGGQLFGVVEQFIGKIVREDDGGSKNRPRQASPSGFVTSCLNACRIEF